LANGRLSNLLGLEVVMGREAESLSIRHRAPTNPFAIGRARAARASEDETFNGVERLFRTYSSLVGRRATAILGERDAAKDITQEVFLRAMNAREGFATLSSPVDWLYRVTTNLCLNRIRDRARQQRILTTSSCAHVPPIDQAADVSLTVRAILRDVPHHLQEIAIYYFVDQMSQDEIASLLGMPRRTVSLRLEQFRTAARAGSDCLPGLSGSPTACSAV
jgi:RNA polymerase sigma-70 factor (ECF subfamily)